MIVPKAAEEEEQLSEASHLVIDHGKSDKHFVETRLTEFRRKCRQIELRRAKKLIRQSNILPPALVGSLWKHLRYRDLHPEMFEKSIQKKVRNVAFSTPIKQYESSIDNPWKNSLSERLSLTKNTDNFISPTKRLNKAVGNIFQRTPSKDFVDNESDFEDDLAHLGEIDNVDKDLISSILEDEKFVESELDSSMKEIVAKESEFLLVKTWFNQVTLQLICILTNT